MVGSEVGSVEGEVLGKIVGVGVGIIGVVAVVYNFNIHEYLATERTNITTD